MMVSGARRSDSTATPFQGWKHGGGAVAPVSARKLAASLWRFVETAPSDGSLRWKCGLSFDRLEFQFCSSLPIPKSVSEGATKWDYLDYFNSINGQLVQFKSRKPVIKYYTRVRAEWCYVITKLAEVIKSERKFCKNMDRLNSNLVHDIAEAKLSTKKIIRNLDKEKKAREELENVRYNLSKEIQGRKAQIGALRSQQRRIKYKVEEERRIRQMGEVWKEEQTQMKLANAKLILEDKYAQINGLIADLGAFFQQDPSQTRDVKNHKAPPPKGLAKQDQDDRWEFK